MENFGKVQMSKSCTRLRHKWQVKLNENTNLYRRHAQTQVPHSLRDVCSSILPNFENVNKMALNFVLFVALIEYLLNDLRGTWSDSSLFFHKHNVRWYITL